MNGTPYLTRQFNDQGLIKTEQHFQAVTTYQYDRHGNLSAEIDAAQQRTEYNSYWHGLPQLVIDANGNQVKHEYDEFGHDIRITSARGFVTEQRFDYSGPSKLDHCRVNLRYNPRLS